MAYDVNVAAVRKILEASFGSSGPSIWAYRSTHNSTEVGGVTAFFAGAGYGGRSPANSTGVDPVAGCRVGDIMFVSESTGGGTPGRAFIATVTRSTANQASTLAATGWGTRYDITISSATT